MEVEKAAVLITGLGLFFAPIVIFLSFFSMRRWWPSSLPATTIAAASVVVLVFAAAALGFSFKAILPNFICFIAAYAAYCFLAISLWRITFWPLRILALLAAFVPIGIGYAACTIGLLGLVFVVGDYTREPKTSEQIEPGLVCRVTLWGLAVGASGYNVSLHRSWDWLPLIERSVTRISVVESGYVGDTPPKDASCADALAAYRK
jgi:hypothetical protein